MTGMVDTTTFNADRMRAAAETGHSTATDLADWLVRVAGIPFRQAHHITGRAVRLAEDRDARLWELSLDDLQGIDSRIRSEEHTSELQSLMRISYAVFRLKKKQTKIHIIS